MPHQAAPVFVDRGNQAVHHVWERFQKETLYLLGAAAQMPDRHFSTNGEQHKPWPPSKT